MDHKKHLEAEIQRQNSWYVSSQFKWAQEEHVKRIMHKRYVFFKKIIDAAIARKGKVTLLDYGCGDGYWSSMLSQIKGCSVTGADYNPLRLKRAEAMAPKAVFYEADLTEGKNNFGTFDIIFCSQVIEHVQDDEGFLKDLQKYIY